MIACGVTKLICRSLVVLLPQSSQVALSGSQTNFIGALPLSLLLRCLFTNGQKVSQSNVKVRVTSASENMVMAKPTLIVVVMNMMPMVAATGLGGRLALD